jgi:hypothetical protein
MARVKVKVGDTFRAANGHPTEYKIDRIDRGELLYKVSTTGSHWLFGRLGDDGLYELNGHWKLISGDQCMNDCCREK